MREIRSVIEAFLDVEHLAALAKYAEPDAEKAWDAIAKANSFFDDHGGSTGISRGDDLSAEELDRFRDAARRTQRRVLFRITTYEHKKLGRLHFCITGPSQVFSEPTYAACYVVSARRAKIVAQFLICKDCNGAGSVAKQPCRPCGRLGWQRAGGIDIRPPLKLVENLLVSRPADPLHAADYDARQ